MSELFETKRSIGITAVWGEEDSAGKVSWVALVSHCIRQALGNVRRSSVTSLLTVVTIAVSIFLLGIFILLIQNASKAASRGGGELTVMAFLKDGVSSSELAALSRKMDDIVGGRGRIAYIDKGQALEAFRQSLGDDAGILEGLDADNPLPASLNVQLSSVDEAEKAYQAIVRGFQGVTQIESVRYSRGGIEQLKKMIALIQALGVIGVVFLFIVAGFIIANTIKLALYNHRIEVEIMQLVGAGRVSIYAPYLLEGLVQGVTGAVVGVVGVFIVFLLVNNVLGGSELLRVLIPEFGFIPLRHVITVVVAGALVGLVGSFLAVRKFLRED